MKKLIFLLGLIAFLGVGAQDIIVEDGVNYAYYTGTAADTINGATTMDAVFYVKLAARSRYTLSYFISGDTLTGCSGNVTIQAYGCNDGASGTYETVGSSSTWTTTANYDDNTVISSTTVTESGTIAQHTRTTATFVVLDTTNAFNIVTSDSLFEDETVANRDTMYVAQQSMERTFPAQTQTVAAQTWTNTNTVNLPGVDYRFIKILLTGASGARVEIDKIAIKVTPITFGL